MSLINHYKILEIPNYSTYAKVRKAYITKVKLYHPDLNKSPEAEELSKQINVAKEALETSARKSEYDRRLKYSLEHKTDYQPFSRAAYYKRQATQKKEKEKAWQEQRQRQQAHKRARVMKNYEQGLKYLPIWLRYSLCGLLTVGVFIFPLLNASDDWFFALLFLWPFYYIVVVLAVNEYYKYHDYQNSKNAELVDLDRNSRLFINVAFIGGLLFFVLLKLLISAGVRYL